MKAWIIKKLNKLIDNIGARAMLTVARYCKIRDCDNCAIYEECRSIRIHGRYPCIWAPERHKSDQKTKEAK